MSNINPRKWSSEWYELATTDELISSLQQAKKTLESFDKRNRSLWKARALRLEEELLSRDIERQDWQEEIAAT